CHRRHDRRGQAGAADPGVLDHGAAGGRAPALREDDAGLGVGDQRHVGLNPPVAALPGAVAVGHHAVLVGGSVVDVADTATGPVEEVAEWRLPQPLAAAPGPLAAAPAGLEQPLAGVPDSQAGAAD